MAELYEFLVELSNDGNGRTIVDLSGDFDTAAVAKFERATASILRHAPSDVIVDCGGSTLIDSAALGAILRLGRDLRSCDVALAVRAPKPFQRQLFRITGLSHLLVE